MTHLSAPAEEADDWPLITILGASGLLGTAITRLLARRPVRLRLVGRRASIAPTECRASIEVRTADLADPAALASAVAGSSAIIHLVIHSAGPGTWRVAEADEAAEQINVGVLKSLLDDVERRRPDRAPIVIFAGSMSQAGRVSGARVNGSEPDRPLTGYDRHKLAAELALQQATDDGVVRGLTLRLATLFTRGVDPSVLDRGVVASMIRRALDGEALTMWHDGTVLRDLLCVDDAAAAFVAALDHAEDLVGDHWLVGTGVPTSIGDLFAEISGAVAAHTGKPPVPVISVPPTAHSVETDQIDFVLDPARFESTAHWSARIPLSCALKDAVVAISDEVRTT